MRISCRWVCSWWSAVRPGVPGRCWPTRRGRSKRRTRSACWSPVRRRRPRSRCRAWSLSRSRTWGPAARPSSASGVRRRCCSRSPAGSRSCGGPHSARRHRAACPRCCRAARVLPPPASPRTVGLGALLVAGSLVVRHTRVTELSSQVGGGWAGVPILALGVMAAPNAVVAGDVLSRRPWFRGRLRHRRRARRARRRSRRAAEFPAARCRPGRPRRGVLRAGRCWSSPRSSPGWPWLGSSAAPAGSGSGCAMPCCPRPWPAWLMAVLAWQGGWLDRQRPPRDDRSVAGARRARGRRGDRGPRRRRAVRARAVAAAASGPHRVVVAGRDRRTGRTRSGQGPPRRRRQGRADVSRQAQGGATRPVRAEKTKPSEKGKRAG